MKAIFKRELRSYFVSMPGYVFMTMFMLLTGVLFYFNNIASGNASLKELFGLLTTWAVFTLPMLTMRLFAEDRRLKTDQLLITSPVSVKSVVLGKYFAAFTMVSAALVILMIYTVIISFFGDINTAETINCFVGFALLCSLILAVGSFISAVSESQIVAIILTYVVLIITVFLGNFAELVHGPLQTVFLWISPTARFTDFTMGIFSLSPVVYYISITLLFLYLTVNVTERRAFS